MQWRRLLILFVGLIYSLTAVAAVEVSVDIRGLNDELTANVRAYLSIVQQKDSPLLNPGRLQRLHNKASDEIRRALQPFGYYQPQIHKSLERTDSSSWHATYTIDPGPPIRIVLVDVSLSGDIDSDPVFSTYLKNLPLHRGDIFNHSSYEGIKNTLARMAAERGYFAARFVEHRVEIDLEAYEARVHLHYDGGERYHFGEPKITQSVLDPELLQRYIPFEQGSPYDLNVLLNLQRALNDSEYFQTVEITPAINDAQQLEVPIDIVLTPRKSRRYTFGLGYGTDTGARARLGWDVLRVNRHGHRFNAEARQSEIGYDVSARYRVPVLDPRSDEIVYSTSVVNEKTDSSISTVRTVSTTLNHSRGSWREALSLSYQLEDYRIAEVSDRSYEFMPGVNWTRTWGRDFINTFDGLRFDLGIRGASQHLASKTGFLQIQGGIKAITPLGEHNRLIGRGRLGSIWSDAFQDLPSSLRFFAGGTQSVRGYAYQSLGPVDANGNVVGGRHLMIGSLELEHSFNEAWGVAVFYDAGNAYDNIDDRLEHGAGLGMRWRSPVGPVRIDLASAISQDGRPWKLHISIGPDL
jgi:translocation and assembly module TamA